MAEDDLHKKLPFRAEYAKSGRAKCKFCQSEIGKGVLRLAIMVKSTFFDGMSPTWYHENCFFLRAKPKSVGDIGHFESLRWEDQKRLESAVGKVASSNGAGKNGKPDYSDFAVEYAKSNRSTCAACDNTIAKQELRIGKKDYESDSSRAFGPVFRWHHLNCFLKVREQLEWLESGKALPGFRDLEKEDQEEIKNKVPALSSKKRKAAENGNSQAKKLKSEAKEDSKLEKLVEAQNKAIYKIRDQLYNARENKELTLKDLHKLLEHNGQDVPSSSESLYDRLADIMTFGALLPCKVCKKGQYVYRSGVGYVCMGYLTEMTKCENKNLDPERTLFKVPKQYRDSEDVPQFLATFKQTKVTKRVIPNHAPVLQAIKKQTATASTSGSYSGPKLNPHPLKNFNFFIDPSLDKKGIQKKIETFGGQVTDAISSKDGLAAAIAAQGTVEAEDVKFMSKCKSRKIPVVSVDFVQNLKEVDYNLAEQIQLSVIVDWIKPGEIVEHLNAINPDHNKAKGERSRHEIELKKVKLKMKDGAVVDPDSGLEDTGHVYKEGQTYYSVILSSVNVEEGTNKFYKLQIIEHDKRKQYWVFRAWGRLGTTIGGNQTDPMGSKEEAMDLFAKLFKDKTGNTFGQPFKQKPGRYMMMDIHFGEKEKIKELIPSTKTSKLELAVQELIAKIFDINDMQQTLLEFELDLAKMPLGKLSQAQVLKAYGILNDAMKLIEQGPKAEGYKKLLVDCTNRFFTLIPHSFGTKDPPLLEDKELVKTKLDMLENLMEIELAYELLVEGNKEGGSPIDAHYKTLKCAIGTLEKSSCMWQCLEKYVQNTHAETHDNYDLELMNIFTVDRKGEEKKYMKYKDLPNRKLLWHGSRTSNYGGILSKGLRIAPPEAPVTGYMFGKGIYFADMVSKSANYCYPHGDGSTGLLLLCEVALGEMQELIDAKETLLKAPRGKQSVKGLGQTQPDPSDSYTLPNGTVIPYGKPTKSGVKKTSLLYNEYIVYDVDQVNILYLVEVKFKFKKKSRR